MFKYYVYSILLFLVLLIIGGCSFNQNYGSNKNLSQTVNVVAVGDNLIHPEFYEDAQTGENSYNFKPMYQPIKTDIQKADVAFVNQESPLGGDDRPYSGFRNFNTPSSIAHDLVDTGFNFVNGANNHAFDQGEEGVKNHIHTWDKFRNKVLFTGVYLSTKEQTRFQL